MEKPTLRSIIYNGVLKAVESSPKFTPKYYVECAQAMKTAGKSSLSELIYKADEILNKL